MNIASYIVIALVLVAVGFALRSIRKNGSGCCGDCRNCSANCQRLRRL